MGLDIGIISINYLDRPQGIAYKFAWEMAVEASVGGYMYGEGNNWGAFTQRKMLRMLDQFAAHEDLNASSKAEILEWVRSLPWDGWRDDFDLTAPSDDDEDDYNPVLDNQDEQDGGLIELHFNW